MKKLFHSILFAALGMTATQVLAAHIPEGTYIQTSVKPSGLGECRTCKIDVVHETPHIIKIVGSNGWIGYAYYNETYDAYLGVSEWKRHEGGNYESIVSKLKLKFDKKTKVLVSEFENSKVSGAVTYKPYE